MDTIRGVDKAIYDLISDNPHIQAIMGVSTKKEVNVHPYQEDTDMVIPCITYEERNSRAYENIPNCELITYKIDIWTNNLQDATRIANAMDDMFITRNYINEYARICQFTLFTSADTFSDQTQIPHKSLIYQVISLNLEV